MGWPRWLLIALALCGPVLFYWLAGTKVYVTSPNIRFSFLLIELVLVAFLLNKNEVHLIVSKNIINQRFCIGVDIGFDSGIPHRNELSIFHRLVGGRSAVRRSLIFGQHLYDYSGTIINPYGSPGSYVLSGSLFLFPGLSIGCFDCGMSYLASLFPF